MEREAHRGGVEYDSLVHRGWTITVASKPLYSSGPEVAWSNWVARKGDQELRGSGGGGGSCPAYGNAIRMIDEIELGPEVEPYEGVL